MSEEYFQNHFEGREIVVTEKMDGENTTLYNDHLHARSIDSKDHPSRSWVKQFWGNTIKGNLSDEERICGENCYAKHSILYNDLPSYFLGFSFWRNDLCLSWDDTLISFEVLGVTPVPTLFRGKLHSYETLQDLEASLDLERVEGYVVRLASEFYYADFAKSVAKYVRAKHVQTSEHWMNQAVIPNKVIG
jgi:hypothetical protein